MRHATRKITKMSVSLMQTNNLIEKFLIENIKYSSEMTPYLHFAISNIDYKINRKALAAKQDFA